MTASITIALLASLALALAARKRKNQPQLLSLQQLTVPRQMAH